MTASSHGDGHDAIHDGMVPRKVVRCVHDGAALARPVAGAALACSAHACRCQLHVGCAASYYNWPPHTARMWNYDIVSPTGTIAVPVRDAYVIMQNKFL